MSGRKYQKHLLVLPEDKANRQIANGFLLELSLNSRAVQVLQFAGGWGNVIQEFLHDYVPTMRKSFESIGESLAKDCAENTNETWGHDHLKHNEKELKRMISSVKPFLFTDY